MTAIKVLLPAAILIVTTATAAVNKGNIRSDETLIVPGKGAESVVLKSPVSDVLKERKNEIPRIAGAGSPGDLFRDIFGIKGWPALKFSRIYLYEHSGMAIFTHDGRVCAVAGLNRRITCDGVDLSRGVEYFRFSYGNRGISVQRTGVNTAFIYYRRGIAVFDDDSDDDIDLYLVFTPDALSGTSR